ncbi:MAG: hypothetical protein ACKV22_30330 [Bryobacteraceae bacterium]
MKRVYLLLLMPFCGVSWGQFLMGGSANVRGVSFSYETRLEPPGQGRPKISGGLSFTQTTAHRSMCDFQTKRFFGYDLTMESLGGDQYRFTLSPLTQTPRQIEESCPPLKGWSSMPLPRMPAPQIYRGGDVIALDLLVNPQTGQKVVDYITVQGGQGRHITAHGTAKDFTAEDASFEVQSPRLSINGKPLDAPGTEGGRIFGSPLVVLVKGRGRFIITLQSRTDLGMLKAGEVRGSTMTWRWGEEEFVLNSDGRIAPGDGAYNLYVFLDPKFRGGGYGPFVTGTGGNLENMLRK